MPIYQKRYTKDVYHNFHDVNGVRSCVVENGYLRTFSVTRAETNVESKTLRQGDHVTALPYTLDLIQSKQPDGKLQHLEWHPADKAVVNVCGPNAGQSIVADVDAAYLKGVTPNPRQLQPDVAAEARLRALAETKALANLRSSLNNVPLLFAERRQTIGLIATKGKQLAALIRVRQTTDLRRWYKSRKADRKRLARDIASEHLGFLFGVLPLVSEIEGLAAQLSKDFTVRIRTRGAMADANQVDTSGSYLPNGATAPDSANTPYLWSESIYTKRSFRTSLTVDVTSRTAAELRDWGFNPIAVAYDLVPLSFLSDFVSNLGTFLRALDYLHGVSFVTGNSTLWREWKQSVVIKGASIKWRFATDPGRITFRTIDSIGEATGTARALHVQRSVLTDFPDPSLHLVNNFSLSKAATIASLAVQRYVKPVRRIIAAKPFRYKGPRPKWLPPIQYIKG